MVLSTPAPIALWVVPVADFGGVARHVSDVVRHGIPGWRVVTMCPPGPLADRLRELGGAVVQVDVGPASGVVSSLRTLRRMIDRLRPTVVHSHLAYADLVCAVGAPRGTRLVSTEHGISGDPSVYHAGVVQQRGRAAAHATRLRRLSTLVAVSESTAQVVRERWSPPASLPIHVVPNGVDPVADPPPADPGLRIGSLSRLAPEKNLQLLLDAFDVLSQTRPEATLAIAGGGPEEAALRRHADALGLGSTVSFEGHVDAEDFLRRIDVVAQLSAWENHSYTLLDAVNYGRGVVATSVGGNPEIVGQASLVGAGSSPGVIAARLESQGLDPAARPVRGPGWQTVGGMCDDLATIYAQVAP